MEWTSDMNEMFFTGGFMAVKMLVLPVLWAVVASIVNRSIS